MSAEPIVIVAAKRTPIGAFQGVLSGATAPDLGAAAIAGAVVAYFARIDRAIAAGCLAGIRSIAHFAGRAVSRA